MCKWGTVVPVRVKVAADLSRTGRARWKHVGIDSCIWRLVQALQEAGVNMRASCCGHGKMPGYIILADGYSIQLRKVRGLGPGSEVVSRVAPKGTT